MIHKSNAAIVTYYGIDGACAAAAALMAMPEAQVVATSARRIAATLLAIAARKPREVHVCGVGVYCEWAELEEAAGKLRAQGAKLRWYCGRGYLDAQRPAFEKLAEVVFDSVGANTACMARHLGVEDELGAEALLALARQDPWVGGDAAPASEEDRYWLDLIRAATSQYLKYQDEAQYERMIHRLVTFERHPDDKRLVETFRRTGYRYLMQGDSALLRELKARVKLVADADRGVLISGESGVGKEHVARLIWERSRRSMGPLIAVNCALYAGSANLANSDLFGHKKGAFTGAESDRRGKFVEADGGILFLDELGELSLEVQAKLLRVIEDGRVMPEGADQYEREVDVRIIAATNSDLPSLIRQGRFRADLFHRLSTLRLHVPPLRAHVEDAHAIVAQRLDQLQREGYDYKLTAADWAAVHAYEWPGNVRQLLKLVDRAALMGLTLEAVIAEERTLGDLSLPERADAGSMFEPRRVEEAAPLEEIQRRYAQHVWELHEQNVTAAARTLGVAANTLRYKLLKNNGA